MAANKPLTVPITVVIPVGPAPQHKRWLGEALASVVGQTTQPEELILVDDMAGITSADLSPYGVLDPERVGFGTRIILNPWLLGSSLSYNVGVAKSVTECAIILCSDDRLLPRCLEQCWNAYRYMNNKEQGYYWLGVRYINEQGEGWGKDPQFVASGPAMVTRKMWIDFGGYPPESSVGHSDWIVLPELAKHHHVCPVNTDQPLYEYREHPDQDEKYRTRDWSEICAAVQGAYMKNYKPQAWGRQP